MWANKIARKATIGNKLKSEQATRKKHRLRCGVRLPCQSSDRGERGGGGGRERDRQTHRKTYRHTQTI